MASFICRGTSSGEVALTCIWVSPIVCACYKRHTRAPNPAGPDGGGLIRAIYTKFDRLKCVPELSDESAKREKNNQETGLVKQMLDERWKNKSTVYQELLCTNAMGLPQLLQSRWKKQNNWIMSDPIMQSRLETPLITCSCTNKRHAVAKLIKSYASIQS